MTRFYPDHLPPFANEPTSDQFAIRYFESSVGEGVIALREFAAGELLFRFTGYLTAEITQYSLQIRKGLHLHDPHFMGKILHSCAPNASCDMQSLTFHALRPIRPGDQITMDYAQTEDHLFVEFPCCCGSADCRGTITGRRQKISRAAKEISLVSSTPHKGAQPR